jgi:REP element-mobilizing transposase RayT
MPRLPRNAFPPSGYFHITTRGVEQRDVYLDRDDRVAFLALLRRAVERYDWDVYAVCLMTNHYHLVVEGMRDLISRGLQRVNGVYAESFNGKYRRSGHLWGDRFALWQIRDEEHLHATCAYVLDNPVRAGLCESATDWEWARSRFGDAD